MEHYDIEQICRVCLKSNVDLFLLFDEENATDGVFLFNMISEMTMFTIRRYDDFPHQICFECMKKVRQAYELKLQFERSHRKLLTYLESINKVTIDTKPDRPNEKGVQTEETTFFPCEKCDDKFLNAQSLRKHRENAHKGTEHKCRICSKLFARIGELRVHINFVHYKEIDYFSPFECLICNKKFTRKHHVTRHMEKIHKIKPDISLTQEEDDAKKTKSDPIELKSAEAETENIPKTKVIDESNENQHYENVDEHCNENDDNSNIGGLENQSSSDEDEDDRPLAILRNSVNNKINDSKNVAIKIEVDECPISIDSSAPKIEETDNDPIENPVKIEADNKIETPSQKTTSTNKTEKTDKKYTCSICDRSFQRSNHLKRHILSHKDEKPFDCKLCDKTFKRSDHLKSHISIKHDNTKSFKCDICSWTFKSTSMVKYHKEKKHNIDFNNLSDEAKSELYCEICKKSFCSNAYLLKHMEKHTNKSWKCKQCELSFGAKDALKKHNKSHNKEKPHLCSECGLRFVRNDYLMVHMRRHTGEKPFKCKYCGKGFPRRTDLNTHVKYHTGEKNHLCTICGKGFQRPYNLVVHMRVHTGERPYKCPHCPRDFAQCNDLKAHIRRHTGERFKCQICGDGFIQGYHLTQHKIDVHGIVDETRKGRLAKIKPENTIDDDSTKALEQN